MTENTKPLFERLKDWLREKQPNYVIHNSWNGDTESGFYDTDDFDFGKLCEEIDAFTAQLKSENRK